MATSQYQRLRSMEELQESQLMRNSLHYRITYALAISELLVAFTGIVIMLHNLSYFDFEVYKYLIMQSLLLVVGGIWHIVDKNFTGYTIVIILVNLIISVWGMSLYHEYASKSDYPAEMWNFLGFITYYFITWFVLLGLFLIYFCIYGITYPDQ